MNEKIVNGIPCRECGHGLPKEHGFHMGCKCPNLDIEKDLEFISDAAKKKFNPEDFQPFLVDSCKKKISLN